MREIIIIANPPYQEKNRLDLMDATPIYNLFIEKFIENKFDEFIVLIPCRWFSGGKGLTRFRNTLKNSPCIKTLKIIEHHNKLFKGVEISGHVCFLHYQKKYNGFCEFITESCTKKIDLKKYDIVLDDLKADSIIEKTQNKYNSIADIMYTKNCFGIETNFFKKNVSFDKYNKDALACIKRGRTLDYIDRKLIKKNCHLINQFKVCIPANCGNNNRRTVLKVHNFFIITPNQICTESYLVLQCFNDEQSAKKFQSYLQTDFARYLLGVRAITMSLVRFYWKFVPNVDTSIDWTDEMLFEHFKLTEEEQLHIKSQIQKWN